MKLKHLLHLLIISALFLTACGSSNFFNQQNSNDTSGTSDSPGTGSLSINLSLSLVQNRSIIPENDMVPYKFIIIGNGPNNSSFNEEYIIPDNVTEHNISIDELLFGEWSIYVEALHRVCEAGGTTDCRFVSIGMGNGITTIKSGTTVPVEIPVNLFEGTGTLDITATWDCGDIGNPIISASLTRHNGSSVPIAFNINESAEGDTVCSATVAPVEASRNTGFYSLSVNLYDDTDGDGEADDYIGGRSVVVQVLNDVITDGVVAILTDPGSLGSGDLVITIIPVMNNPLDITLDYEWSGDVGGTLTYEGCTFSTDDLIVTATADLTGEDVIYLWYLNGIDITATDDDTVTAGFQHTFYGEIPPDDPGDLPVGYYRLDVLAYIITADGVRAGSATHSLNVSSAVMDVDGDGQPDACDVDVDGDGVENTSDSDPFDSNVCSDTDSDGCDDCTYGSYDPANDGVDSDGDGICD